MVEFNIIDIFEEEDCIVVKYSTIADDGKPEVAEAKLDLECGPEDIEIWARGMQIKREAINLAREQRQLEKSSMKAKKERVRSALLDAVQTNYT